MDPALDWVNELDSNVIVCDEQGTIIYMNEKAARSYAKDGGRRLVGSSVFDCHPGASREKTLRLFAERQPNNYTISKNGKKKIIHQLPWFRAGQFAGFVELSIEIPPALPHFDRE
jgi:transcriptional regulator with PAS, ATPase and Fis domain